MASEKIRQQAEKIVRQVLLDAGCDFMAEDSVKFVVSELEAAERVRGEDDHVVLINKSSTDMAVCRLDCNGEPYGPGIIIRHGRELVIRKAVK